MTLVSWEFRLDPNYRLSFSFLWRLIKNCQVEQQSFLPYTRIRQYSVNCHIWLYWKLSWNEMFNAKVLLYTIFSLFSYEKCSLQLLDHLEKKLQNVSLPENSNRIKKENNIIGLLYFSKETWANWLKFVSYNQT